MTRGAIYFLVKNLVINVYIGLHKYYHINVDHYYVFIGLYKYYHINVDHYYEQSKLQLALGAKFDGCFLTTAISILTIETTYFVLSLQLH